MGLHCLMTVPECDNIREGHSVIALEINFEIQRLPTDLKASNLQAMEEGHQTVSRKRLD